jgi:DNA-binding MarR family transcriptional regulator
MTNQKPSPASEIYRRIVTQCTNANVRRAERVITDLYDEFLKPSGLLGTQFRLLGAIASKGTIALTPLADEMELDRTTLARNLKVLERESLVEMTSGEDRRVHLVKITQKGQEAMMKALPLWEEAQAWIVSQMGEERWRAMLNDWTELVERVRQR